MLHFFVSDQQCSFLFFFSAICDSSSEIYSTNRASPTTTFSIGTCSSSVARGRTVPVAPETVVLWQLGAAPTTPVKPSEKERTGNMPAGVPRSGRRPLAPWVAKGLKPACRSKPSPDRWRRLSCRSVVPEEECPDRVNRQGEEVEFSDGDLEESAH